MSSDDVIVYVNHVWNWDHEVTVESVTPHRPGYFMRATERGCFRPDNKIALYHACENIFDHVREGRRYRCKVVNGIIVNVEEVLTTSKWVNTKNPTHVQPTGEESN